MTDLDFVNAALGNLGVTPLTVLDNSTPEGVTALALYATTRDALLQSRAWTFACTRAALTLDAGVPAFGYTYQYQLPNNALAVIACWQGDGISPIDDFKRELNFVLTNFAAPIFATVKVRVNEASFPPLFSKALIAQLTADFAVPFTENRASADSWEAKAEARLMTAAAEDGKQGTSEAVRLPKMPGRRPTGSNTFPGKF